MIPEDSDIDSGGDFSITTTEDVQTTEQPGNTPGTGEDPREVLGVDVYGEENVDWEVTEEMIATNSVINAAKAGELGGYKLEQDEGSSGEQASTGGQASTTVVGADTPDGQPGITSTGEQGGDGLPVDPMMAGVGLLLAVGLYMVIA